MLHSSSASIESRSSWTVATVALITLLMAFGGAWITPVALKDISAEAGGAREVPDIGARDDVRTSAPQLRVITRRRRANVMVRSVPSGNLPHISAPPEFAESLPRRKNRAEN